MCVCRMRAKRYYEEKGKYRFPNICCRRNTMRYWNCEHRGVVLVHTHASHMAYATYEGRQEIRQPYSWLSGTLKKGHIEKVYTELFL